MQSVGIVWAIGVCAKLGWGVQMHLVFAAVAAAAAAALSAGETPAEPGVWAKECQIRMASTPAIEGEGVVVSLLDHAAAMAALARTEANAGGPIDRDYVNNQRAAIEVSDGRSTVVVLPAEMSVAVGDRLAFQSAYRNPNAACSYVPNLATRKLLTK